MLQYLAEQAGGGKGWDCHQLQQLHSNRCAGLTGGCGPWLLLWVICPPLHHHPVSTLIVLDRRRVMASSNYRCVDTLWSIHNQTWMLTQWILRHAVDNGILFYEKYFSRTRERFLRLYERDRVWLTCVVRTLIIVIDLLTLIRETENDDLTSVLQKFVCEYSDDIAPLAVEITTHLVRALCFPNMSTAMDD